MKKAIDLVLAVFVLILCLCGCQRAATDNDAESSTPVESTVEKHNAEESLTEKLIREIEGAYSEEAYLPDSGTTIGMVELAAKYTEKWEQVADEYYNKIMEYDGILQQSEHGYSSADLHTFVSNMKTNWEQYNQVQCDNYLKALQTMYGPGTVVGPIMADYEYEMQKEWALQLVGICEQLDIK